MAAVNWVIWKTRNKACFQGVYPHGPNDVVHLICHWIDEWSGLQKENAQEALQQGSRRLVVVEAEVFDRVKGWAPLSLRLEASPATTFGGKN